jgi:hypothetical protein
MRRSLVYLFVLLLLGSCDADQAEQPPDRAAARDKLEPGWVRQLDVLGDYAIDLRDSWSFSDFKQVASPVKSHYLDISGHSFELGDYCAPGGAMSFVEPRGMSMRVFAISKDDYFSADDPARQEPGSLHLDDKTLATYEGTGCHAVYRMIFRVDGVDISAQVALGKAAPESLRRDILTTLNSIAPSE